MALNSESNHNPTNPAETKPAGEVFFQGCILGDIEQVSLMLARGFNPNYTDNLGATPLIKAAKYNQLEIIKLLISQGANVNAQDNPGWTALRYAVYNNRPDIEQLLKSSGAKE